MMLFLVSIFICLFVSWSFSCCSFYFVSFHSRRKNYFWLRQDLPWIGQEVFPLIDRLFIRIAQKNNHFQYFLSWNAISVQTQLVSRFTLYTYRAAEHVHSLYGVNAYSLYLLAKLIVDAKFFKCYVEVAEKSVLPFERVLASSMRGSCTCASSRDGVVILRE